MKPDKPGKSGMHGSARDIDKWLPPKQPWVAVTVPGSVILTEEIPVDVATQTIELLPHQFDMDGNEVARRIPVMAELTPTGFVISATYLETQILYKVKDKPDVNK